MKRSERYYNILTRKLVKVLSNTTGPGFRNPPTCFGTVYTEWEILKEHVPEKESKLELYNLRRETKYIPIPGDAFPINDYCMELVNEC